MQRPGVGYVRTLDSLRAIAALLVLWQHTPKEFLGPFEATVRTILFPGALGVELFFILSGFLITRILLAEKVTGNTLWNFYSRRACRIIPAYYLVLLICFFRNYSAKKQ